MLGNSVIQFQHFKQRKEKNMTAQELQKRNGRGLNLRVLQVDPESYFAESSDWKVCYKVTMSEKGTTCTCVDYARNVKSNPAFSCPHIEAVRNSVARGDVQPVRFLEPTRPRLKENFIITLEGKDFVTYPGLLDLAHQKGIQSIEVEPIQLPTKGNDDFAICQAKLVAKTGEVFSDLGPTRRTAIPGFRSISCVWQAPGRLRGPSVLSPISA
mgnify:CR=1 FL=1